MPSWRFGGRCSKRRRGRSAIRDGALSFEELLAMAGGLQRSMEAAAATTQLPPDVDYDRVDGLLVELLDAR